MKSLNYISFVFLFILGFAQQSEACSCRDDVSFQTHYQEADSVFVGQLVSITRINNNGFRTLKAVFKVISGYKGVSTSRFAVTTPEDSATCGVYLQRNDAYLIFADRESGVYSMHSCGGTSRVQYAPDYIRQLPTLYK